MDTAKNNDKKVSLEWRTLEDEPDRWMESHKIQSLHWKEGRRVDRNVPGFIKPLREAFYTQNSE